MKQGKVYFFLAVCVFLLTAFAGCSVWQGQKEHAKKSAQIGENHAVSKVQELLPQEFIKVGFVQVGHESDWRIAATKSCKETFTEENGYCLYFVDADNDPKVQVTAVRNLIQEQVDYLVIDPILTTGWTAVLKEAYHARIPVLLIDRTIDCDAKYYCAWFGSDFVYEGECAGRWLQSYLSVKGRGSERIRIAVIQGTKGASAQLGRTEGFAKYVRDNANWEILAEESGDFTESGGKQVMQDYLKTYPKIDVVICQNDNEAIGACAAMDEAGISYGKDGDVIVISFDATRAGLEAVMEGKINADFECNPLTPPYIDEAIQILESGGRLKKKNSYLLEQCFTCEEYPMRIYTKAGVKEMIHVTKKLLDSRNY